MSISIIIPTTDNRNNIVLRTLEYYKHSSFEIIVVDSSKTKNKYLENIQGNVKYLHLPKKNFSQKMEFGINIAKHEFVNFCQDDDFVLIESLNLGLEFLKKNIDYSAVHGNYIFFEKIYNKIFNELGYSEDTRKSFNSSEFTKRLNDLNTIAPQAVSVLTYKKILLKNFTFLKNFQLITLFELSILFFISSHGSLKYIDIPWQVRDKKIYDISLLTERNKKGSSVALDYEIFFRSEAGIKFSTDLYNHMNQSNKIDLISFKNSLNSYTKKPVIKKNKFEEYKVYLIKFFPTFFIFLKKFNFLLRYILKGLSYKKNQNFLPRKNLLIKIEQLIFKFK
jgi:glycosyltransferase domain-containing protein